MTSLTDTLTVGLVLVLLFGSIALYLYTRIQQAEQKISLLESILLDLKMSAEIKSYSELPAENIIHMTGGFSNEHSNIKYQPFNEVEYTDDNDENIVYPDSDVDSTILLKSGSPAPSVSSNLDDISEVREYKTIIADAIEVKDSTGKVSVNYESMILKELQTIAKTRGISGAGSMKKNSIIEALKTSDRSSTIEPGSIGIGSSSFLETSTSFQSSVSNGDLE